MRATRGFGVDIHSPDYSFYTWTQTDAQGRFRAGLAPGTYVATARSDSSAFTDSAPVEITVASDGSFTPANLNLVLGTPQLIGTVVDAGHFVAEEAPRDTLAALQAFFTAT